MGRGKDSVGARSMRNQLAGFMIAVLSLLGCAASSAQDQPGPSKPVAKSEALAELAKTTPLELDRKAR
jgi:hypothetical protein